MSIFLVLDKLKTKFESDWSPQNRGLQGYLEQVDIAHRSTLLRELIGVDVELAIRNQLEIDPSYYEAYGTDACRWAQEILRSTSQPVVDQTSDDDIGPTFVGQSTFSPEKIVENQIRPLTKIGPYKLLQQIGEGGMGSVWMAQQESPVRRRVAIKLIKGGVTDKKVIARFEAERQALAIMEHGNIAKVLDAGTTEAGTPYFVMELVKGIPINKYCDRNKLTPDERLKLFVPICKAVHHAHQKGIIHRDLKPSNVLVQTRDGEPMAKVIDFGLAKALQNESRLTDKTMFTEFGQVVGTLQYMSPEQATMDAMDVDTRTDIYSLGAMLYELLVGSTPVEKLTVRTKSLLQVLEVIREKAPPRPSHRFGNSGEEIKTISDLRQIPSDRLQQILRGELDWVVMKAIENDRTRRYETANDFAEDINRYLDNKPVKARPPSTRYLVQKFVRNNMALVSATVLIVLCLLGGIAGTTWFAFIAQQQKNLAVQEAVNAKEAEEKAKNETKNAEIARQQAVEAQKKTDEALKLAEDERAVAIAVRKFMENDLLRQANPYEQANAGFGVNKALTVVELVERAAIAFAPDQIESRFPKQPLVQSAIMSTIAEIASAVKRHDIALTFADAVVEKSLADSKGQPITADYQRASLNKLYYQVNSQDFVNLASTVAKCIDNLHRTLQLTENDFPTPPQDIDKEIDDRINAWVQSSIRRSDPANIEFPALSIDATPAKLNKIISALQNMPSKIRDIERLMTARYGQEDFRTTLGYFFSATLDYVNAEIKKRMPLPDMIRGGSYESAIEKFELIYQTIQNQDDQKYTPMLAGLDMTMAVTRRRVTSAKNDPKILELFESSLARLREYIDSEDHPAINNAKDHVANTLISLDRFDEGSKILTEIYESRKRTFGPRDYETAITLNDLALAYLLHALNLKQSPKRTSHLKTAQAYYDTLLPIIDDYINSNDPRVDDKRRTDVAYDAAETNFLLSDYERATVLFQQAWEYRSKNLTRNNAGFYLKTAAFLAQSLHELGRTQDAVSIQKELIDLRQSKMQPKSELLIGLSKIGLAQMYIANDQTDSASEVLADVNVKSLEDHIVKVKISDLYYSRVYWEAKLLGWRVFDFEIDKNGKELLVVFTFKPDPSRFLRYGDSKEEYAANANDLKKRGYSELKQATWTRDKKSVIASLWQRPKNGN